MIVRSIRNSLILLVILLLAGGFGYNLGKKERRVGVATADTATKISGTAPPANRQIDFSLFWDVWDRLSRTYIDRSALDPQKMVYGAISGMVASLDDPYTVFLPPKENKDAKDELGGQFEGIGAQLGIKEKRIVVIAPLRGLPAEKAGIKAGDWIVKVDGKDTGDWSLPKAVSAIRGAKGTSVLLTILHQGDRKTVDISVTRDAIHVPSVEWDRANVKCLLSAQSSNQCEVVKESCTDCQQIAHLRLTRFGDKTISEWEEAVKAIAKAYDKGEIKGIVLDLRNNPGGYLSGSVYIASEFLGSGLVVTQQNHDGTKQVYEVNRKGNLLTQPLVVLVNKGSASASEIVAGALKVRGRAKLVGETTFGKGSVQDSQDLPGGAGLHITVSKWLLPDDSWINGKGVEPDTKIEPSDKEPERDVQLEKAGEVLLGSQK